MGIEDANGPARAEGDVTDHQARPRETIDPEAPPRDRSWQQVRSVVVGYLRRSLVLASATVILVAVVHAVATMVSVVGTGIRVERDTGAYGPTSPIITGGPSEAELWYQSLSPLGGWLLVALGVMLLIVQPVMAVVRRWTPSRGLANLGGLAAVAMAGVVFGVLVAFGGSIFTWIAGGASNAPGADLGSALAVLVFGLVVYGIPALIVAALALGLAVLIDRRGVRTIATGVAGLIVVVLIVASTGAFRPPPAQDVAASQQGEAVQGFTRALDGIDGIANIEVVGAGATITMALDASVGDVISAADAAKRAGEQLPGIAIVVIQRKEDPTSTAQQQDPPRGPWRVQLVPSDRGADEIADELQRLMLTERLQVKISLTEGLPLITADSMEALPAAVRELRTLYPDGAHYSVPGRFTMTDDPSQLSTAMVDVILDIVTAYPAVKIEVNQDAKLFVGGVTPEEAPTIIEMLQQVAGTSPTGSPADYVIYLSGDGDDIDGTFG